MMELALFCSLYSMIVLAFGFYVGYEVRRAK